MDCPSCGHANREGARFCLECGHQLDLVCPTCGQALPPAAKFCDGCGQRVPAPAPARIPAPVSVPVPVTASAPRSYTPPHLAARILQDRAALEGERKQVTVLFCDFANSTPLAERLGPEGMHRLLGRFFELALAEVHRYEGTVNQFLGDGFMALFGAPVAHEDHARRAVLAALGLQRAVEATWPDEERPALRMGLNTGLVVVGAIGDNLRMDYTAIGDTTNLAARMEQAAAPGAIYLTRQTHRLVSDYIECEPVGPLTVKGKAEAISVYRAVRERGIRTRIEAAANRGLTPLVSRAHELAMLAGYGEQAARGRGQVVFITGEAGIGKSRLLLEFRRGAAGSAERRAGGQAPPLVRWLEGHCISYGRNIPYLPVIDILKGAFGIEEGDDDARIIARVDAATTGWDAPARATVPYLKFLLSVDPGDPAVSVMDPLERRAGIFDALRAALVQAGRDRPLVLVVEDLHWVDEKSEEALAALLDVVAATPVLLLLTARPGYSHRLGERTYFSRLALGQLTAEESGALAGAMLGTATLPDELRRLVAEKAEGNPFYIEEVTRSLLETGVLQRSGDGYALGRDITEVHIPDTIQDVILARIDRLAPPAKESIQLAAVIGREFTVRLLGRISDLQAPLDDLLSQLKALELIYEKAYFPELAYMFKHALTHDVAYATLLSERRKALHRLVAAAIEELYSDRLAEQYEALAHHYSEGEVWEQALDYLVKAGDKAAAVYANTQALDFYAYALAVCERLGDAALSTAVTAAQSRGSVNLNTGKAPDAATDFDRMLRAARRVGDRHAEGMALVLRGIAEFWAHDLEASEATLRAALAIADEGVADLRLRASFQLGRTLLAGNRHAEAEPLWRAVEEMAATVDDPFSQASCGHVGGLKRNWTGDFDDALEHLKRWRGVAEASNDISGLLGYQWTEALVHAGKGEYEQSLALLHGLIATSDRIGEVFRRTRALNSIGWVYGELQDHARAIEWNTRGVEAAREMNVPDPEIENNARLNLGDSLLALGRLDEAEEHFRQVEHVVRHPRPQDRFQLWRYAQHFFHSYGELWLARGDHDRALDYADECLALADESNSRKNVVKARRLRGQVFLARGKLAEAEQELAIALEVARAVGNPPQLWKTLAALGELRAAQGRPEEARQAYREALAVIEDVAAGLTDQELRETLLGSAHVQGIRQAAESV